MELFKLLDWCIASSTLICATPYWGLELKPGTDSVLGNKKALQRCVETVLDALISIEVRQAPDTRATHWVLLCRSVALGLRVGGTNDDDGGAKGGDADGDAFGGFASTSTTGKGSAAAGGGDAVPQPWTFQAYATWARDYALKRAQGITVTRARVKCIAIQCATTALLGVMNNPSHAELSVARVSCQSFLASVGSTPSDAILEGLPSYMALFLHDIVNFACASATYSIEDNRLVTLQSAALEFLACVVKMFWACSDPDEHSGGTLTLQINGTTGISTRILQQFISQIVSAIRTCLSAQWHPSLLQTAGELTSDLIRGGFLSDKLVTRRVAKLLLPLNLAVETNAVPPNQNLPSKSLPVRAPSSDFVADDVSTIQHIVSMTNVARLFLLTCSTGPFVDVESEARVALHGLLEEHLSDLTEVWFSIAIDTVRVCQGERHWPKSTAKTDARLGGLSYSPSVNPVNLAPHLEMALPYILSAAALSPHMKGSQASALFAIGQVLLEHLRFSNNSNNNIASSISSPVKSSDATTLLSSAVNTPVRPPRGNRVLLEDLVILTFSAIANKHNNSFEYVSVKQWTSLLSYIIIRVLPTRIQDLKYQRFEDICVFIGTCLDVLDGLLSSLSRSSNPSENGIVNNSDNSSNHNNISAHEGVHSEIEELYTIIRLGLLSLSTIAFEIIFSTETSALSTLANGTLPKLRRCPATVLATGEASKLLIAHGFGMVARMTSLLVRASENACDAMMLYVARVVTALLPYVAVIVPPDDSKVKTMQEINQQLCSLSQWKIKDPFNTNNDKASPSDFISYLLFDDLKSWHKAFNDGYAPVPLTGGASMPGSKKGTVSVVGTGGQGIGFGVVEARVAVLEAAVNAWIELAIKNKVNYNFCN